MEWILSWVKSGLLFGIFASIILMLCPNKIYQKHIGLIVGMLFILVMMHPLMTLMGLDSDTYTAYLRNFLMLETQENALAKENVTLYENSVEAQLMAVFLERGYPVKTVRVNSDQRGNIGSIAISFSEQVTELEGMEQYIKRLFGKEVRIRYENG